MTVASPIYCFIAGPIGAWRITAIHAARGEALPAASHLDIVSSTIALRPHGASWMLRASTSNVRYSTRNEIAQLAESQPSLGRAEATKAALIPIRKSREWWDLAQDERRAIFEETSKHTRIGQDYLPSIARRLHHGRDLGEPFDFVTWFEFAPEHEARFDELVYRLRGTREWEYVEREVEVRLERG